MRRSRTTAAVRDQAAAITTADARIDVHGLAHGFPGGTRLFEALSFGFGSGDIVAICGPSGSGKSTLLSILAGWEEPVAGTVTKQSIDTIAWVFQNPHGVAHRTAIDHVAFPFLTKGLTRAAADARARETLATFGLQEAAERPFHALSGGEAQRLMLARAVAIAPDLLLVDEPTAQLDQSTARSVNATLRNIADGGSIVLIATHDQGTREACGYVVDLADYAPLFEDGGQRAPQRNPE
ncbi:ATP-binding cassette domain-containing protein [Microbacterium oleivorans]|uniref:ATP-binding cassette domain-containing protein n=1 Tax=Microbacterium oleivorans TaxID=273677 RepID=UPI00211698A5|nr:ATP-binding cassette domain-containing protein [Microbacterium oleivorans]